MICTPSQITKPYLEPGTLSHYSLRAPQKTMFTADGFDEFLVSRLTKHIFFLTTPLELVSKPCWGHVISMSSELQGSQDIFLFPTTPLGLIGKPCLECLISMNSELQGSQSIFLVFTTLSEPIRKLQNHDQSVWFQWFLSFRAHEAFFSSHCLLRDH